MTDNTSNKSNKKNQRGNILMLVMGGIAMTAVLGITTFSLMSGPLSTMISVNKKSIVQSQVQAIARIALMDAQNRANNGDSDGDGIVELLPGREAAGIDPVEFVPSALGTPTRDPWGNDYYYCTWDMGGAVNAASTLTLAGASDPFRAALAANAATKLASSQTLLAVFSSGANGVVNSTCADWANDTTATFTCAGDDICKSYTYSEAAKQVSGIWSLKAGTTSTITTSKNLELGSGIGVNAQTGDGTFTTLTTTGKLLATGGAKLPLETNATVDALCGASYPGLLRYNNASSLLQVCNGSSWSSIQGSGGGGGAAATSAASEWAETTGGSAQIYYNRTNGGAMVGTTTLGTNDLLKIASTDSPGAISVTQLSPLVRSIDLLATTSSFATLPATGNTIIVTVVGWRANASFFTLTGAMITDNQGGTYTQAAVSTAINNGSAGARAYIFYRSNITAPTGTFTITITPPQTPSGQSTYYTWGAMEVAGLATSSVVDVAGGTASASFATTTTVTTSGPTTQANDLAVAVTGSAEGAIMQFLTPQNDWESAFVEEDLYSYQDISAVYKNLGSTGTVSHSWTGTGSYLGQTAAIATFKGAVASQTTPAAKNIELMSFNAGNGDYDAQIDLYHGEGTAASPQDIEVDDNTGYVNFYGYRNGGWRKGFQLTQEIASTTADMKFALGTSIDTLDTAMWMTTDNGLTVGPTKGSGGVNVSGPDPDIFLDGYSTTAANGPVIQIRKSRGSTGSPSGLVTGDMLGAITWAAEDGNGYSTAAAMNVLVRGTVSNTRLDTDMVFQNSPTGNASATAINAETMRISSNGSIGVNTTGNPGDGMRVNGIVRLTDTAGDENYTTDVTGAGPVFAFIANKAAWRVGAANGTAFNPAEAQGYNSLSSGYGCSNLGDNSWCHGTGSISTRGINSILLSGTYADIGGANAVSVACTSSGGDTAWTYNDMQINGDYSLCIGAGESNIAGTAHHSAIFGGGANFVNGSYSYALGTGITVADADSSGDDFIFAVNLAATPTSYAQAHTLAIMNGKAGVGTDTVGAYALKVVGQANKSAGGGTWDYTSDGRLKDIHGPYKKGMREIAELYPIRFKYKQGNVDGYESDIVNTGFSAQAVQAVFPEAVRTRPDGYLDLDLQAVSVAQVNAIQELNNEQQKLLAEQKALQAEQEKILAKYEGLRREADHLMNVAGIPSSHGFWMSFAIPFAGFMAFGFAYRKKKS